MSTRKEQAQDMSRLPAISLKPGDELYGFRVQAVTPLPGLRAVAYQIEHLKSGARLLHLHTDDSENMFCIAFRTPPDDDTGLPHILEHSVLDGSRKYAAKKPFFEMVKMSMATFINAMTYPDKTVYPIASTVEKDFFNLADVYFDAVFHPRLTEWTLKQEGRRLDFTEKGDIESPLLVKGIVYNEMKGALSSPDSLVYYRSYLSLFPDTCYGKQSGGDPAAIPSLTYEAFRRFHSTLYHPSNAFVFLYGNIPTEKHLAFLSDRLDAFNRCDVPVNIGRQPRWNKVRTLSEPYPVAPGDDTTGKTYLGLSWIVGDATNALDATLFSLLELILIGSQAAPLRKALIDSRLGQDLHHSGFEADRLETTFRVGLQGSEAHREPAFVALVEQTLDEIARNGITEDRVNSAFQQLAYRYQEIPSMFPLWLMDRAYGTWIYGGDPLAFFRTTELMDEARKRWNDDPDIFGTLIRERLLQNPHRLSTTFVPDPNLQARRDFAFAESMASKKAAMSAGELQQVLRDAEELDRLQSGPNTPDNLAALPQLRVSDVPRKPQHIPTRIEPLDTGVALLRNDVFAHGVNYLQLDFDLAGLPDDLFPYLSLYGDCVRKMGTTGLDYAATAERVAANTGGISFQTYLSTPVQDPAGLVCRARFAMKALDDRMDAALAVLGDLVFKLDPRDTGRLSDVLVQSRAGWRRSVTNNSLSFGVQHACRSLSPVSYLGEILGGMPQARLIEELAAGFEHAQDGIVDRLESVRAFLLNRSRLTVSFTGSDAEYGQVRSTLTDWTGAMSTDPAPPAVPPALPTAGRRTYEGLAAPVDVAYCVQAMPAPHVSDPVSSLLSVGGHLLSLEYMLEEIRVKGGAYGAGCSHNSMERLWRMHSYRDPWVKKTLDVFGGLKEFVAKADWSQDELDRSIIGTAKDGERPIRPEAATGAALTRHIIGDTPELRNQRHAAVLAATPAGVRQAVLDVLENGWPQSHVCVVSNRQKLEAANTELAGTPLSASATSVSPATMSTPWWPASARTQGSLRQRRHSGPGDRARHSRALSPRGHHSEH
jgi:Zn-dependent M16 (insulinase) family peptidase